jgi:hypothetical protein
MRTRLTVAAASLLAAGALLAGLASGRPAQDAPYPFKDGFPTPEGTKKAHDDADYQRAVTAYRFWYPTVSCEGIFNGNREQGLKDNEDMTIMAAGPRQVAFTANSDTPYGAGTLDVKDGPYVIELPAGPLIGLADDHNQGWILDMGLPGPDGGKGGKHLILPPNYKEEPPRGYFVGRSASNKVLIAVRSLPVKGDARGAMDALRSIKVYPLATAANPKLLKFVDTSEKAMDLTCLRWEDNLEYWKKLHEVIDAEPLVDKFLPM